MANASDPHDEFSESDGSQLSVQSTNRLARGPRTICISRDSYGFGFTLRHFIVYPPNSLQQGSQVQNPGRFTRDGKWVPQVVDAMDTIFVREVRKGCSADRAGLVTGDRIIAINSQPLTGKSYAQVVDLIRNSGNTLELLVVPKEDDILQLYFSTSAYQPVDRDPHKTYSSRFKPTADHYVPNSDRRDFSPIYANAVQGTSPTTPTDWYSPCEQYGHPVETCSKKDCKCRQNSAFCRSDINNVKQKGVATPPNYCTYPPQPVNIGQAYQRLSSDSRSPYHVTPNVGTYAQNTAHCDIYLDEKPDFRNVSRLPAAYPPTTYASSRPYRFQDTFSKLLLDMWYPQKSHHSYRHHEHLLPVKNEGIAMAESDERRDHKSGFANLFSKTMRAFITSPGEKSDGESSSGGHGKSDGSNHSSSYSRSKHHHHKAKSPSNNNGNAIRTDRMKNLAEDGLVEGDDTLPETDHISSLHLVAQRLHQFESGSFIEKAQERTKLYKHEFARVSNQSPCRIVSKRAAQFENMSPSQSLDQPDLPDSPCSDSAVLLQKYNSYGKVHEDIDFGSHSENYLDCGVSTARPLQHPTQTRSDYLQHNKHGQGVIYRKKPLTDHHIARRISYLKATAQERILVDSDLSEDEESRLAKRPSTDGEESEHRISKLKAFFGERTPKIRQAIEPRHFSDENLENWRLTQGWLSCKILSVDGKRSTDRSWKPVWAVLKGNLLHLFRDKKDLAELQIGTEAEDDFTINLKMTLASIAHDYTKRKHVLRLRLAGGSEYLFQAESQSNMLEWLRALHAVGLENEKELLWHHTSVLEKAAAYEQQLNVQNGKGRLSPVPATKPGMKLPFRHRSPTGQSPSVKTRRASQGDELGVGPRFSSVLRNRVVPSWKKAHSLQTEILPKGSSVGVRLEDCPVSTQNPYLPVLVELCTKIVEARGLELVGVYRIPGNNAAVSMLIESVNQGFDAVDLEDPRWKDVNVVSSLLKAFFRKLREPLLTSHLYQRFINVSKLEDPEKRLSALKKLIHDLPRHHFETLKFLMKHLLKIVEHSNVNKMEARNLAIVFGPTLARPADSSMVALVTDMSHQCYIIETMINYSEWLFNDEEQEDRPMPRDLNARRMSHPLPVTHSDLLLSNIQKLDGAQFGKSHEAFSKEFLSSVLFAPNRKALNRARKVVKDDSSVRSQSTGGGEDHHRLSNGGTEALGAPSSLPADLASVSSYDSCSSVAPSLCGKHEVETPPPATPQHQTYDQINSLTQERIRKFESETKALLRRDGQPRHPPSGSGAVQGRVQWGQIEREWEKAKRELEQEDLLDYVADDPSFLNYLLNRQNRDEQLSDSHLESINSTLNDRLSLSKPETDLASSSPAYFPAEAESCHPRRFSCATDNLNSYESRLFQRTQPLRTAGIHRTENVHITATVSPTRHTITTSSSSPFITATSFTQHNKRTLPQPGRSSVIENQPLPKCGNSSS